MANPVGRPKSPFKTEAQPAQPTPQELEAAATKQIKRYQRNPLAFAKEMFGFNPSNQQRDLFIELGKLVSAKMKRDEDLPLTDEEVQYVAKRGISVRSGKGTGKDASAAIIGYWFLFCFFGSKTYLLAPSLDNLKSNLIAEMSLWRGKRNGAERQCKIAEELDLMTTSCRMKRDEDQGKNWFIASNSAGPHLPEDQQAEVLHGKHARYMMFIMDEASGIPDAVFKPLDTTLTDPVNFIILIWNPTRRSGFAYNTHFDPTETKYWVNLHWNAEQSDMITPEQIFYLKDKYGEDSNQYRVSVLGEPPTMDDGSLIPYEWAMDATNLRFQEQDDDPVIMGVDVARKGKDKSIILVRKGPRVLEIEELSNIDTVELSRWVAMRAADWRPKAIYIDSCGLGIGVVDELNRQQVPNVYPVNVGRATSNPRKFHLLRDELWWKLRERFEKGLISLAECPDKELISEISSIQYDIKDNGKIKVESKMDMRNRNMPSPNKGDALMMTMMIDDKAYYPDKGSREEEEQEYRRRNRRAPRGRRRLTWLEV